MAHAIQHSIWGIINRKSVERSFHTVLRLVRGGDWLLEFLTNQQWNYSLPLCPIPVSPPEQCSTHHHLQTWQLREREGEREKLFSHWVRVQVSLNVSPCWQPWVPCEHVHLCACLLETFITQGWIPSSSQLGWFSASAQTGFFMWHSPQKGKEELVVQLCAAHKVNFEPHNTFKIIAPLAQTEREMLRGLEGIGKMQKWKTRQIL